MNKTERSLKATNQRLSNLIITKTAEIKHLRRMLLKVRDKIDNELKTPYYSDKRI